MNKLWMRQKIQKAWQKLLHENATPNKIAIGFAIGLFTAFFPAPILDTLVALALAYMVRANRASCLVGNNFVLLLFPIIPFVFGTEYLIGRILLHLPQAAPMPKDWNFWILLRGQGPNYHAMVIGAIVLAVPSAIGSFIGVKIAITRWQIHRSSNLDQNRKPSDLV